MTVIPFHTRARAVGSDAGGWRSAELEILVAALAPTESAEGQPIGWAAGVTEAGDPQFYLLAPPPQEECICCISRLGRSYILEDGAGRILFEHNSLVMLAERAQATLQRKKTQILGRVALMWFAIREAFEERFDAVMGEGDELLVHLVPQLAVLA
jgi:hypothetical protein